MTMPILKRSALSIEILYPFEITFIQWLVIFSDEILLVQSFYWQCRDVLNREVNVLCPLREVPLYYNKGQDYYSNV